MAHSQDQTIIKGSNKTYRLTVVDLEGQRVDLTGATVYMTVRDTATAPGTLIVKTSATPAEAVLLDQTVATTKGQADFFITHTDTAAIPVGKKVYDIWVKLASNKRYCVVEPAQFTIAQPVSVIP